MGQQKWTFNEKWGKWVVLMRYRNVRHIKVGLFCCLLCKKCCCILSHCQVLQKCDFPMDKAFDVPGQEGVIFQPCCPLDLVHMLKLLTPSTVNRSKAPKSTLKAPSSDDPTQKSSQADKVGRLLIVRAAVRGSKLEAAELFLETFEKKKHLAGLANRGCFFALFASPRAETTPKAPSSDHLLLLNPAKWTQLEDFPCTGQMTLVFGKRLAGDGDLFLHLLAVVNPFLCSFHQRFIACRLLFCWSSKFFEAQTINVAVDSTVDDDDDDDDDVDDVTVALWSAFSGLLAYECS